MPLTRRELLKGLGVAVGGLGLAATNYEHLVPFIHQPENIIPGVSAWYATSCRECPAGCGMLVRNREARDVKCEGNPNHPINRGALCARGQAALHGLYDPHRIKGPMRGNGNGHFSQVDWQEALRAVGEVLLANRGRIGIISDLQTGSLSALMRQWLAAFGSGRLLVYEPIDYESVKAVYGGIIPAFNIAASDYLISFNADFLETWISPVEYAWQFAVMRQITNGRRGRFVYVGPRMSMTAANADECIIVPSGAEALVANALAASPGTPSIDEVSSQLDIDPRQLRKIARELAEAQAPLVLPGGDFNTARAVSALNTTLGTQLVSRNRPHALSNAANREDVQEFISAMEAGEIEALIVYGANPVYALPEADRFLQAMNRVNAVISLTSFMDETSTHAHWILPSNTPLESWGDYEPQLGVVNLMQPTMGQIFNTMHTGDILINLARSAGIAPRVTFGADSYLEYLRNRWGFPIQQGQPLDVYPPEWESLLQLGGRWPETVEASEARTPLTIQNAASEDSLASIPPESLPQPPTEIQVTSAVPSSQQSKPSIEAGKLRLYAYPHIYFYDGRGANRCWLQEMPEPVTKVCWGSWIEIHPSLADRLGVRTNDVVEVSKDNTKISAPVYVWNGVHPDVVAVPIGQGHSHYGDFANGVGINVWPVVTPEAAEVKIRTMGTRKALANWQHGDSQHRRSLAQTTALGERESHREVRLPLPAGFDENDFYPGHEHKGSRWVMVVDLDRCIGCNACVAACYAENNVAVVGEEGVRRNRVMAWLRIDRYFDWSQSRTPIIFQPMLCQHCDVAPCESVCPVYAAAHSEEGINMQVYNRCVGTRYCSNNCPYKVRRFNWFQFTWPEPLNWQLNPDVTVRDRGVMEKCTFCIQRIREAQIIAKREHRALRDDEIIPACVQTCPTGAFTFGDLNNPDSRVSRLFKQDPRAYQALYELNTKPGVVYLRRIIDSE